MSQAEYPVGQWVRNIVASFQTSSDQDRIAGLRWYSDARQFATMRAIVHDVTIEQVADLISVLSPQKAWTQNLAEVDRFLAAYTHGHDLDTVRAFCTRLQRAKIRSILTTGDGLRGPKVSSFRDNILNPWSEAVTVDSWAVRVALADASHNGEISSDAQYRSYASANCIAATALAMLPSDLQAVTWVYYRRLYAKHHAVRAEYATA